MKTSIQCENCREPFDIMNDQAARQIMARKCHCGGDHRLVKPAASDEQIRELVELLKECHADQLLATNALAIRIGIAIREHDADWVPELRAARTPWPTNAEMGTTRLKARKR